MLEEKDMKVGSRRDVGSWDECVQGSKGWIWPRSIVHKVWVDQRMNEIKKKWNLKSQGNIQTLQKNPFIIFFLIYEIYQFVLSFWSFFLKCMCLFHLHLNACGEQKKMSTSLELDLQAVLNCLVWTLGGQLRAPGRRASPLNTWAPQQQRSKY